jgi:undecaprenyl-diphosphatase
MSFLLRLDHGLRAWVVTHRIDWLNQPIFLLTVAGLYGAVWVLIALVLALARRMSWRDVGRLLLVLAVTTIVTDYVLKPALHRARPFEETPEIRVIGQHSETPSFPSGHTATAVAGAFVFTRTWPAGTVAWWVLAAAIAYSRVYLGVHYPLDLVAGAIVGLGCALCIWLFTKGR